MKKTVVALPYIVFVNVALLGQTLNPRPLTNPLVNRFEPSPSRFPPTLVAPIKALGSATLKRPSCVYPSLATNSLSIRPCQASPRKLRLFPPFKRIAPSPKPAASIGEFR
jgi:hypothetical protein